MPTLPPAHPGALRATPTLPKRRLRAHAGPAAAPRLPGPPRRGSPAPRPPVTGPAAPLLAAPCRFSACPKKWPSARPCWGSPSPRGCSQLTADHPWSKMMVSCDQAQLMANLVKLIKAKKVIEIGVFTGYNTLNMALVLPDNGRVIACDINEDYVKIGKPLWKEAGVEHKIDLRIKPAIQTLDELLASGEAESFDFAFIDADKESCNEYYEKCLRLIKKGGIIAIDNVSTAVTVVVAQGVTAFASGKGKKSHSGILVMSFLTCKWVANCNTFVPCYTKEAFKIQHKFLKQAIQNTDISKE
uniref:Catechol-O-methyltransferase domain containing 1 n=1 Tax=Falco tinnunculus TaxID=100819 RepID=A0A8C4UVX3_FALTI